MCLVVFDVAFSHQLSLSYSGRFSLGESLTICWGQDLGQGLRDSCQHSLFLGCAPFLARSFLIQSPICGRPAGQSLSALDYGAPKIQRGKGGCLRSHSKSVAGLGWSWSEEKKCSLASPEAPRFCFQYDSRPVCFLGRPLKMTVWLCR